MNIRIRKFKKADLPAVKKLLHRAFRITLSKFYNQKYVEKNINKYNDEGILMRAKNFDIHVAEDLANKKILGVVGFFKDELRTFFVDPAYHGRGVGRKLFDKIKKRAAAAGYNKLWVSSSLYAVPIYKKFGFKRIRKIIKQMSSLTYFDVLMRE